MATLRLHEEDEAKGTEASSAAAEVTATPVPEKTAIKPMMEHIGPIAATGRTRIGSRPPTPPPSASSAGSPRGKRAPSAGSEAEQLKEPARKRGAQDDSAPTTSSLGSFTLITTKQDVMGAVARAKSEA